MPKPKNTDLLKPEDYISTREHIEYSKANMPALRKKLPVHYSKPLMAILLKSGLDYPAAYIRSCIRNESHHNIYVVKACEVLANRLQTEVQKHAITDVKRKGRKPSVKLPAEATK